jgi:hypothetical protein
MGRGNVLFIRSRKGGSERLLEQSVERDSRAVMEDGGRSYGRGRGSEAKLEAAIQWLGERWLLHPNNAPRKSKYNQWGREE